MMLRRTFLLMLGSSAALAGCTTTPPVGPAPAPTLLQTILGYLKSACGIVADASAILALIGTFPAGTTAVVIANSVCAAVNAAGKAGATGGGGGVVVVHGVTIPYTVVVASRLHRHR